MNTIRCFAVQDKVLVYDPDGNAWEVFYQIYISKAGRGKNYLIEFSDKCYTLPMHNLSRKRRMKNDVLC